ncbi:MAG: TetR/AcrR family transcriptional regulator [Planctomycetota bacterium]|nr:MAG: TetR/AcrR family transcriptional regulator [Planctomycetota bacterium]
MSTALPRTKRMSGEKRKQAILQAAAPVIARAGFQGASVRDIAEAAGVSEALLYKHFPSKQALYDEALAGARESSQFTIARFATLEPGTESFVLLTYATVDFILFGFPGSKDPEQGIARLVFQSLLGDGSHARAIFADTAANWMDYVLASYQAAIDEGDIVELPIEPPHRFRFVQQLAMALRLSHLPEEPAFAYRGSKRKLADQAVLFSLRGVGLTDAAIKTHFQPRKLRAALARLFSEYTS